MIKIDNLCKTYNGITVLENINLHVAKGEIISIIGASGAGKSTLIRCINLLEKPEQGEIYINNTAILDSKVSVSDIRKKIGMVFQKFNLFEHLCVIDNLTIAPIKLLKQNKKEAEEKARHLLKQVGLLNKENCFPRQLSGGQKQRVAIARCLAMNPEIILFDEPTSALDPIKAYEVLAVIRKLAKSGITMVVVTHEMNFAKEISDRIVYMHNGRICEIGSPEQIFNNPIKRETREFIYKECNFNYQINGSDFDVYSLNSEILDFLERYSLPNDLMDMISGRIQYVLNLLNKLSYTMEITLSYFKDKRLVKLEMTSKGEKFLFQMPEDYEYKRKDNKNILETYFEIRDRRKKSEEL
ncbi:MAG: amino acid ABC transporter ATP-binding protein [Clostridia bacterium]|nr:amino acid ABC transporter ATP-binding protein [Clostridia bacterium]